MEPEPKQLALKSGGGFFQWFRGLTAVGKLSFGFLTLVATVGAIYFPAYQHACVNGGPFPFGKAWLCGDQSKSAQKQPSGEQPVGPPSAGPLLQEQATPGIAVSVDAPPNIRPALESHLAQKLGDMTTPVYDRVEIKIGPLDFSGERYSANANWRLHDRSEYKDCSGYFTFTDTRDLADQIRARVGAAVTASLEGRGLQCG